MPARDVSAPPRDDEDGPWPLGTIGLCATILVVLALEQVAGVMERPAVAGLRLGALDHGSVYVAGELWRLLPAAFVHFPFFGARTGAVDGLLPLTDILLALPHALLNGWALIQLGTFVESVWGTARLLVVFFLSALGCSLASAWFAPGVSAGASGGLFGLMGFLLAARTLHAPAVRSLVAGTFGRQILFWVVAIVVLGSSGILPIDQAGHLGGLATGLLLGAAMRETGSPGPIVRGAAIALVFLTASSFGVVATEGDRAARIEAAFEDAAIAASDLDRDAAGKALDQGLAGGAEALPRFVGHSPARALVLVEAAIAAVRSADALRYAEAAAPLVGPPYADVLRATADLANRHRGTAEVERAREELARVKVQLPAADRVGLALFYERAGWSGPALELLQSVMAEQPKDASVVNAVAWVLLTARDERFREPARGLELARRSVELVPDSAESLDTLAEGELQGGLIPDALGHERRALDLARQRRDERLVKELAGRLAKIEARAK